MKKSTTGIVAGALGLGLLAGGSTFALWSDTQDVNAGKITAGNLDVSISDQVWTDISTDAPSSVDRAVAPAGVAIPDIEDFLTVPGDTLHMTQDIRVVLSGDNIAANLTFDVAEAASGGLIADAEGVTLHYSLYEGNTLKAEGDEIADLDRDFTGAEDVTYRIETVAAFDSQTSDQVRVNAIANLQTFTANLVQVRR